MIASWRLRNKLIASFMVILSLLALSSALAFKQFVTVGHEVEDYAQVVEGAHLAAEIESRFLKLQTHAREYVVSRDEAQALAVQEIAPSLLASVEKALATDQNPKHRDLLEIIAKDTKGYLEDFEKVKVMEHAFLDQVKAHLMPTGEQLTETLDRVMNEVTTANDFAAAPHAQQAMKHMLLAQLYSNIVIGNKDASYEGRARSEIAALNAEIESLSQTEGTALNESLISTLEILSQSYQAAFDSTLKSSNDIRQLINGEMAEYSAELISSTETLQQMAKDEEQAIEAKTMNDILTGEIELLVIGAASFLAGLGLAWFLGRALARPVQSMTSVMRELSSNNLEVTVPYSERTDEMGEMATSVKHFKDKLIEVKRLEREQQEQKLQAEAQRRIALMEMADIFEKSVGKVVQAVSSSVAELQASSSQMAANAKTTSQKATTVSAATEETTANVQTVASACEELAGSNREIGRNIQTSAKTSQKTAQDAEETETIVASVVEEVEHINRFAKMISEIADQTNMLALNATIESARAGEAGKGFAVVAQEVKALAQQTAEATAQIVDEIKGVNLVTSKAAEKVSLIGKAIKEADQVTHSIAAAIEQQLAATEEIARSVEQASEGTQQVSTNIHLVEEASTETGEAAEQIAEASLDLSKQSEFLKEEVAKFLHNVRAGDGEKTLLDWHKDYEVGILSIDEHHKHLFTEINYYHGLMFKGVSRDEVDAALSRAIHALDYHIKEALKEMSRSDYPGIDSHRVSHRQILERLSTLQQRHDQGDDVSLDFFDTLKSWLMEHIEKDHRDFSIYVHESQPELVEMAAE